jgi:serine/threonine protein kinase
MSQCLNPSCLYSQNPDNAKRCQRCGSQLRLRQRYLAKKILGQGGFGRTFLAVDEGKPSSRPYCVIKQLDPQAQGTNNIQKAAQWFEREAKQLDELGKHPQIPELLEYCSEGGRQYLVQEYINGPDLARVLRKEGNFSEGKVRDVLKQLLPILDYLHQRNVIHRDIKPDNIIRDRNNKPILVDFGTAKHIPTGEFSVTGTGIGTKGYMAPEQSVGKTKPNSDIYSLGATCIHLLTGKHPFNLFDRGKNKWIWRNYLPRPIDSQLAAVLDKMLVLATENRYQSANEVLHDLSIPATEPSPPPTTRPLATSKSSTSKPNRFFDSIFYKIIVLWDELWVVLLKSLRILDFWHYVSLVFWIICYFLGLIFHDHIQPYLWFYYMCLYVWCFVGYSVVSDARRIRRGEGIDVELGYLCGMWMVLAVLFYLFLRR